MIVMIKKEGGGKINGSMVWNYELGIRCQLEM